MKLKNGFSVDDRFLFIDNYECWICGRNSTDALHHIVGRGGPNSVVENSILNAAPVHNYECHINIHGKLMTREYQSKLLKKTLEYLESINYELTDTDKSFKFKYKNMYV